MIIKIDEELSIPPTHLINQHPNKTVPGFGCIIIASPLPIKRLHQLESEVQVPGKLVEEVDTVATVAVVASTVSNVLYYKGCFLGNVC